MIVLPVNRLRMSSRMAALLCAALALAAMSCSPFGPAKQQPFQMGERVQLGPLVYTVLEAEWLSQLGSPAKPRIPVNKFTLIRLTITNGGGKTVSITLLKLIDDKGNAHMELAEGEGVEEWIPILREIAPAETLQGRIVFDVPVGNYNLQATDGAELSSERTALIAIQARFGDESLPLPETKPQP